VTVAPEASAQVDDYYEENGRILHKQPWHPRPWRRKAPPVVLMADDIEDERDERED